MSHGPMIIVAKASIIATPAITSTFFSITLTIVEGGSRAPHMIIAIAHNTRDTTENLSFYLTQFKF
jgi:hypothetical protein